MFERVGLLCLRQCKWWRQCGFSRNRGVLGGGDGKLEFDETKNNKNMKKHQSLIFLISLICCILHSGCSLSTKLAKDLEEKNSNLSNVTINLQKQSGTIRIGSGNLLDSVTFSTIERSEQLKDFIVKNKTYFTIPQNLEIEFLPDTSELIFDVGGIPFSALYLYQSYKGVKILENQQQGIFNAETGELKIVSIDLHNTLSLTNINIPSNKAQTQVSKLVNQFLEKRLLPRNEYKVSTELFISTANNICGYKVDYLQTLSEYEVIKLVLLINPEENRLAVFSSQQIDL